MNNKRKILSKLAYFRRIILQLKKRSNWKGALLPIYGFTPDKMELYKDIKNKKYLYVNDYFRYNKFWQITDNYRVLFNDKLVNYYFLKNFTSKLCPIYGYFDQNNVFNIIDDNAKRTGPFFIKPRNGFAGRGVILTDDYKSIEPPKNSIVCPQINK